MVSAVQRRGTGRIPTQPRRPRSLQSTRVSVRGRNGDAASAAVLSDLPSTRNPKPPLTVPFFEGAHRPVIGRLVPPRIDRDPPSSFNVVNHWRSSSYAWFGRPSWEHARPRFAYGAMAGTARSKGDPSTMPLIGEYEPSTSDWAREQTERFEKSGGTEGNTLRGMPIIVMTSVGASSGKLRKTPLMRLEHEGECGGR